MSIQPYQLIILSIYIGLIFLIWKVKNTKVKMFFVFVLIVLALFNPLRTKQRGGEALEKSVSRFENVPEKVEVNKWQFGHNQKSEYNELKKESEGRKDEIHD